MGSRPVHPTSSLNHLFRRPWWIVAVCILVLLAAGVGRYLFRTKRFDTGVYLVQVDFRFGEPWRCRLDGNYDDEIDIVAFVTPYEYGLSVDEVWQDHDFDGIMDHYFLPSRGEEFLARIDDDGDGKYDREIKGKEAVALYPLMWGPLADESEVAGN